MTTPAVPTAILPNGTTLSNSIITVSATPAHTSPTDPNRVMVKWQSASDSAFTTDVHGVVETSSFADAGGKPHTQLMPIAHQGTWYLRAKSVDVLGNESAYSSYVSFTISAPPNAVPTQYLFGDVYTYASSIDLAWQPTLFGTDTQGSYQVILETATGTAITDTGQVTSSDSFATMTSLGSYKDVQLRWKVRIWDNEGIVGPYSDWQLFTLSDGATVVITAPADPIDNPSPTVTWTFAPAGGRAQTEFQVSVVDEADAEPTVAPIRAR